MFTGGIERGDHHTSLESFTKAAADGCYICAPLLKHAKVRINDFEDCFTGVCKYGWDYSDRRRNVTLFHIQIDVEKDHVQNEQDRDNS